MPLHAALIERITGMMWAARRCVSEASRTRNSSTYMYHLLSIHSGAFLYMYGKSSSIEQAETPTEGTCEVAGPVAPAGPRTGGGSPPNQTGRGCASCRSAVLRALARRPVWNQWSLHMTSPLFSQYTNAAVPVPVPYCTVRAYMYSYAMTSPFFSIGIPYCSKFHPCSLPKAFRNAEHAESCIPRNAVLEFRTVLPTPGFLSHMNVPGGPTPPGPPHPFSRATVSRRPASAG